MEIFVDFGLFEFLAAAGLVALSRKVYAQRKVGSAFLVLSLLAPAVLVFLVHEGRARWVAVLCLVTALINGALIFSLVRRYGSFVPGDGKPASPPHHRPQAKGEEDEIRLARIPRHVESPE